MSIFISRHRLRLERERIAFSLPTLPPLQSAADAVPLLHLVVGSQPYEVVGAVLIDRQNRITGYTVPYTGGLNSASVEPRGLLLPALLANATGLIVFHNHPGGDTTPSREDVALTRRLQQAAQVMGLELWDHLILGDPPKFQSIFEHTHRPPRPPRKKPLRRVDPKFMDPDTGETWSGRGSTPRWLRRRLEAGAGLEQFRIGPGGEGEG